MKTKIIRPYYGHLLNCEFPLIMLRTIEIAGKYDMAGMYLDKSFDELRELSLDLDCMNIYNHRNDTIAAVDLLDRERNTLINSFNLLARAFEGVDLPTVRPYAETLNTLLAKYRINSMAISDDPSETKRVCMLEKEITESPAAQMAIVAFNIQAITDRLFDVNKEFDKLFHEYTARSGDIVIDINALRDDCTNALNRFFNSIECCAFEHENIDYSGLVSEINELNSYYQSQLKMRYIRRRNKKNKGEPIFPPEE